MMSRKSCPVGADPAQHYAAAYAELEDVTAQALLHLRRAVDALDVVRELLGTVSPGAPVEVRESPAVRTLKGALDRLREGIPFVPSEREV